MGVSLNAVLLNKELAPLEERSRDAGRMFAQEDLHRVRGAQTQLAVRAGRRMAALRVFTVRQLV